MVPSDESIKHIEKERNRKQELAELSGPIDLFEYRLAELEVPDTLQNSRSLSWICYLKINSDHGNSKTIHNKALEYISTLKRLFRLLKTEVFLMNAEQLETIFRNPGMGIRDKSTFIYFWNIAQVKGYVHSRKVMLSLPFL